MTHPTLLNKKAKIKNFQPTCIKRNVNARPGPKSLNSLKCTLRMDELHLQHDHFGSPVLGLRNTSPVTGSISKPNG